LIVLSILLRVVMVFWLGDRAEPVSGAFDQVSYDTLAQRVLAGHGFSFPTNWYPFTPANEPTAHWSYLYTLYLAGVYAIVGHHPLVARLVQVLLSGLNIWFAYRIGRRLFGEWAGITTAALTAVYAYFIFFNATLMTQTFYILAVLAALELTLGLVENPIRRGWILLGVTIGIGALVRQTLLIFAPLLFLWIILNKGRQVRWGDVFLSLIAISFFILPWTTYNYLTFHDFLLLNSNGGYWFYSSNHPAQGTTFDQNFAAPLPENLKGLGEPAADRALYREGLGFIAADPTRFLHLSLSRVQVYFWIAPSEQSAFLSNLGRLASFTIYLPFMLYGIWLSLRSWHACMPLYLYVAFDTMLSLTTWAAPRYRLPSDAVMMVFAGMAIITLATQIKVRFAPVLSHKG
jgi:4-amino-4-deoxy-L-arabinose transferase-like glycosyltransferase